MFFTPSSLHNITVITLASIFPAIATITVSTLAIPNLFNTSISVVSAHLQTGKLLDNVFTTCSFESTAITSTPLLTSSLATEKPYLPKPNTAYVLLKLIFIPPTQY